MASNSLYKQSVLPFIKYLKNCSAMLNAGLKFCDEGSMKEEEMLTFRLREDMRPLPFQIQSCCNTAKGWAQRTESIAEIFEEDNEKTFAELQDRITRTIELLGTVDEKKMDNKVDEVILMKTKMGTFKFETGQQFFSEHALPYFHFHMTTAYCIMRHLGVPLDAFDYMGKDTYRKVEEAS